MNVEKAEVWEHTQTNGGLDKELLQTEQQG